MSRDPLRYNPGVANNGTDKPRNSVKPSLGQASNANRSVLSASLQKPNFAFKNSLQ